MTSNQIQFQLSLIEGNADAERLNELTRYLSRDLRELGVESVERPEGEATMRGAKGDVFTMGALALVAVPAFLPKLVEFLQAWSLRGENRSIKIKTPAGLEVEFTPEKRLSHQEIIELVEKMTQV